jgi:hypothetical protein
MKAFLAMLCQCLLSFAAFAQSDRGTITGTVSDPANAVVPGAIVTARNADTGGLFRTVTTATGNYTLNSLPKANYDLSVSAAGFTQSIHKDIPVQVAQTIRLDVILQVGSATESVTVNAELPLLRTENAEQSINLSGNRLNALPINFGGGSGSIGAIRDPLSFLVLAPGVSGTGLQAVDYPERATVNGAPGGAFKIYLEGQDTTETNDTVWTTIVTQGSVDAIAEFSMQTSNFAAEFGGGLGAVYNFTTKSGTNQFHGSAYEYFSNEAMDAGNPFGFAKPIDRKNDFGWSVGGPVYVPKLYNGRDKTFFFFNTEIYRNKSQSAGFSTVPTNAYRTGDFSGALTGRQLTTTLDPLGRTIVENTIYDPLTQQTVNGAIVRDPFPRNILPLSRLDPVALKVQALIPQPTNSNTLNNWAQILPNHMYQWLPSIKIDHIFNPSSKLAFYYSAQYTDKVTSGSLDGLPIPLTGVAAAPGIYNYTSRLSFDHTFTPTLLSHVGFGYVRFDNPTGAPPEVLNYDAAGKLGFAGAATTPGGFPRITGLMNTSSGGMLNMGSSGFSSNFDDHMTAVASTTYIRGNHSFKVGADFKQPMYATRNRSGAQGTVNISATETGLPALQGVNLSGGSVGFPYASFLLGLVDSGSIQAPSDIEWRKKAWALYAQDSWKITRRLTLDYGLRWDYSSQGHEIHYRTSEFSAAVLNPSAGNLPGGMVYEGYGQGRCNCTFTNAYPYAIGPRLGLAYQINSKTVIRAGWGVTYSALANWWYLSVGLGVGYNALTFSTPAYGQPALILQNGLQYNRADLYSVSLDPGLRPTAGQLNAPSTVFDQNGGRPARVNQWNIALQREVARNVSLEAAYVGNRGIWLEADSLVNINAIPTSGLQARGLNLSNAADRTLLTSPLSSALVIQRGFTAPYAGFPTSATVAQSLRPYPQYNGGLAFKWAPLGDTWYDALQMKLTKRYSHGLDMISTFSWQKEQALGTGGNPGAGGGTVNDVFNRQNQKSLAANSQPWVVTTGFNYTIPGLTPSRLVQRLVGGWVLGGILRYSAGSLIPVPTSNNQLGSVRFQNTVMNRVPGQPLFTKDPNCKCIDPYKDLVLNPAAWSDAPAGQFGTSAAYYNDYRWQHQASETFSLGRTFHVAEKVSFQLRAEFFNAFNRVSLPVPSSTNPQATVTYNSAHIPTSGFGYLNVAQYAYTAAGQRNGQLLARFTF